MKLQIENLKAQMRGRDLTFYQKADALREFNQLLEYVEKLESEKVGQFEQQVSDDFGGRYSQSLLKEWDIVGMNHYYVSGEKFLFVAMQKDGKLIKEEGKEDKYFWDRLWHKASQNSR